MSTLAAMTNARAEFQTFKNLLAALDRKGLVKVRRRCVADGEDAATIGAIDQEIRRRSTLFVGSKKR